ncbi:hypothetical protein [Nocardioides terrisoli]|uniref:hypothetical protein n=1 Tax=Nocardioides terrisoli TaxID=3388267 RepID=UPI00287BB7AB|nr:hypothetical protein [Nocardioides marmorisolisilvae]
MPATRPATRSTNNIHIGCTASDPLGILAGCTGIDVDASDLPPGTNTFRTTATDRADNTRMASTSFTVEVTYASLCTLTQRWVAKDGVTHSLCSKLDGAERADARGNHNASAGIRAAYRHQLDAQAGRSVTRQHADTLENLSRQL